MSDTPQIEMADDPFSEALQAAYAKGFADCRERAAAVAATRASIFAANNAARADEARQIADDIRALKPEDSR